MLRPRVKCEHQPFRHGQDLVRIGGIIPGIAADIPDPDGWVWALLTALDGSRTVDQIVTDLVHQFPTHTAQDVRTGIEDLWQAGYLDDSTQHPPAELSPAEQDRYGRGRALLGWMDRAPRSHPWETQMLLRQARVVVVGIGGAGCTAGLALVLSGVGQVHCVEPDHIELSNLNRQVLFTEQDLGRRKLDAAVERLRAHNREVQITGEALTIDSPAPLARLATRADVLVMTADMPPQIRSWANRACQDTGTAWVHAGYHGPLLNVGLYRPGTGPCYDCAYTAERHRRAQLPPLTPWTPWETQTAHQAANAVTAGIAGSLAAHAAMSLITGAPALRANREYGLSLVTLTESPRMSLDAPHPDCPTCQPTPPCTGRAGYGVGEAS
jgi:molybdopterin/thiamine biosynthesis adenylyltransferase